MGNSASQSSAPITTLEQESCPIPAKPQTSQAAVNPLNPKGIKPCCACPETKDARDKCFFENPPDTAQLKCSEYIEAHRKCMAGFGFKV